MTSDKIRELEETILEQSRQLQAKDQAIADLQAEKQALENVDKMVFDILEKYLPNKNTLIERVQYLGDKLDTMVDATVNLHVFDKIMLNTAITRIRGKYNDFQPATDLANILVEYGKEKFWWDKWIGDGKEFIKGSNHMAINISWPGLEPDWETTYNAIYSNHHNLSNIKQKIKEKVYQYYRDK